MIIKDKYLEQWIKETYSLMTDSIDLSELDWTDMVKFSLWLENYFVSRQPDQLMQFFLWFRLNGEKHQGESIEIMIETYLKESIKNE